MILLDTHIWFWALHDAAELSKTHRSLIEESQRKGEAFVSSFSFWEIAKLVHAGRLRLFQDIDDWFQVAISDSTIQVVPLTPQILISSTNLPGKFHRDPADQLIVATARVYDCPLVTVDTKILAYPHVQTQP